MSLQPPPSPEELRAAAALARALEGTPGAPEAPSGALEAAQLLRYGVDADLDDGASERVLATVLADLEVAGAFPAEAGPAHEPAPEPERLGAAGIWRRLRGWLVPAGGVLAAGASAAALLLTLSTGAPPAPAPATLPRPDAALLRLQAQALSGRAGQPGYDRALRGYRARLHASLADRYGEDAR